MSRTDLKVIIEKVQQGEKQQFRHVILAYHEELRALIASTGIRPEDADDVAQEAFLHAYLHIDDYTPGTNFGGWLTTIARYKARAFIEESVRRRRNQRNLVEAEVLCRAGNGGDRDRERLVLLRRCLARLRDWERELLDRRYAKVPLRRLAQELEVSQAALKMRLLRIRRTLRACMEGSEI